MSTGEKSQGDAVTALSPSDGSKVKLNAIGQ